MSLSHLFVSYIHETERDDMSYFSDDKELLLETRKKLIFVLSTTPELTEEYKLLGSIARRCLFDFERYANNVIHDMIMFAKVPLTDKEKREFIRYLADLISYNTTTCKTEDVVLCRGLANYWGVDVSIIDEEIDFKLQQIDWLIDSYKEKREQILTSYKEANVSANKPNFVHNYILRENLEKQQYICETPF